MALDELHARRLATIGKLFDDALERMELLLRSSEKNSGGGEVSQLSAEQVRFVRDKLASIRNCLRQGLGHFAVQLQKPEPKQMLIAELSTLWVILENARPERMTGYGRGFAPEDKAEWESLFKTLFQETEQVRGELLKRKEEA